jgi:hypothetical protein
VFGLEIDGAFSFSTRCNNDPYCPEGVAGYRSTYTGVSDLRHEVISGAGHITIEDGFRPRPPMLTWCLTGDAVWATAAETDRAAA